MRGILIALAALCLSHASLAQTDGATEAGIVIVASGSVSAPPDIAVIEAGVQTEGKTAEEALAKNKPAVNELIETAKRLGVQPGDMRTSQLSLQQRPQGGVLSSSLRGASSSGDRQARISLSITVRDLSKTGAILDALVNAGANTISGVTFQLSEPQPLRDEARRKAVEEAKRRAALYASAFGVKLGEPVLIAEGDGGSIGQMDMPSARASRSGVPLAVQPGEIEVTATIRTIWRIAK